MVEHAERDLVSQLSPDWLEFLHFDNERILVSHHKVGRLPFGVNRWLEKRALEGLDGDLVAAVANGLDNLDSADPALAGDLNPEHDGALDAVL
jgi:hypothetical protein